MGMDAFLDIGSDHYFKERKETVPFFKKEIPPTSKTVVHDITNVSAYTSTDITYNFHINMNGWGQYRYTQPTSYNVVWDYYPYQIFSNNTTSTTSSYNRISFDMDVDVDIWGCEESDKNIMEGFPEDRRRNEPVIPWSSKNEIEESAYESPPNVCPWLSELKTGNVHIHYSNSSTYYKMGVSFDQKELEQYFKLIHEGNDLFDDELFDLCMDGTLIETVRNGFVDDDQVFPWENSKKESHRNKKSQYLPTYTDQMRWKIPWIVDMLRDIWRSTITEDLVDEYFSSEWYNIQNPELRAKWFSPPKEDESIQFASNDDRFIRYRTMLEDLSSSTTLITRA